MLLHDTLTNLMAGFGTDKDKVSQGQFGVRTLDQATLDALYSSDWIAGNVVDIPAEDETRAWREWQAGQRQIGPIEDAEKALGLRAKVRRARKLARKDGGAAILLGTGEADPSRELRLDALPRGGLRYLHVFSKREITAGPLIGDVQSPYYGEPESYEITGGDGRPVPVHPSRVVRFMGQEPIERGDLGGWGASVLQRLYDTVLHAATAIASVAGMTTEAKVDVFGIPNLTAQVGDPVYRSKVLARFALANMGKSTQNALIRDAAETWEQKTINFAGLPDVVRLYLEIAAGASGMPASRLLGKAPTGLNSSVGGDAETRAYYDKITSGQDTDLRPTLERLDEALIRSALGSRPKGVWYRWASLWQLTDAEKADIALKRAQTLQIHAGMDLLPPSALRAGARNQMIEDGTYPGLEAALATADAANEAPKAIAVKAATPKPAPGTAPKE